MPYGRIVAADKAEIKVNGASVAGIKRQNTPHNKTNGDEQVNLARDLQCDVEEESCADGNGAGRTAGLTTFTFGVFSAKEFLNEKFGTASPTLKRNGFGSTVH